MTIFSTGMCSAREHTFLPLKSVTGQASLRRTGSVHRWRGLQSNESLDRGSTAIGTERTA